METFTQPPSGDIKTWMALNLGLESLEIDLNTKPVHNVWVVPGLKDRMKLNEYEMYDKVEEIVCAFYYIDVEILRQSHRLRKAEFVLCRQLIFAFMRVKTDMASGKIGSRHKKDHATVLHSNKVISNLLETDKGFRKNYAMIEMSLEKYSVK